MKRLINFFLLTILACNEPYKYETEQASLVSVCQGINSQNSLNKKLYLITGLDGCNACLEYTVKFIQENYDNKDMVFIVSGKSKVQLKAKFSNTIIRRPNFVLDTALLSIKTRLIESGFPKTYLCKNSKIVEAFEVTYVTADDMFTHAKEFVENSY